MSGRATILVVDDSRANVALLEALLRPEGYTVVPAGSGEAALATLAEVPVDLVLLDVQMPGMDGHAVCRRVREDPAMRFLPVVMITSNEDEDTKLRSIEAGADDFVPKPFKKAELLARVRSLLRVKQYHDTIETQASQLAEWNRKLEDRVAQQVAEIERLGRLRRFLSPQLAEIVISTGEAGLLESHRRPVAVVFCDLRGFTSFVDGAEPETVMDFLRQYHEDLGRLVFRFEGTLEHFAGDGIMVFFNDPVPCADPAARAVRMALAMQERVGEVAADWRKRGPDLGFGVGIAFGDATLGMIGFEGRRDYGAVGRVVNLASRLCDHAQRGQTLIDEATRSAVERVAETRAAGSLSLKGFSRPVTVFEVTGWRLESDRP